jgi:hypothetical protein
VSVAATKRWAAALALSLGLGLGNLAAAEEGASADAKRRAEEEFEAGLTALEQSEFRAAAEHFLASSAFEENGAALFSAGKAWLAEGDRARAADAFTAALQTNKLRKAESDHAKRELEDLEAELATLEITGDAEMTVEISGRAPVSPPVIVHAEPGTTSIAVTFRGRRELIDVVLVAAEHVPIDLQPGLWVRADEALEPTPVRREARPPARVTTADTLRRFGIMGGIATGVGVGFAVGFGVSALSAKSDFEAEPTRENYDAASRMETGTNVAWVLTGIVGAASGTLLVLSFVLDEGPGDEGGAGASAWSVRAGPSGAALSGRF